MRKKNESWQLQYEQSKQDEDGKGESGAIRAVQGRESMPS
jgi:hypothetical protein